MAELKYAPEILFVQGGPGFDNSDFFSYLKPLRAVCKVRSYRQKIAATLPELCEKLNTKAAQFSKPKFLESPSTGSGRCN